MSLSRTILITGASSGIGAGIARTLAQPGARLVLGARRVDRLQALADELRGQGAQVWVQALDVTQRAQVDAFAAAALAEFGSIDVIVNNAGVMPLSPMASLKVDEWDRMIDVNTKGVLYGSRQLCLADSTRRLTVQRTVRAAPQRPLSVARGKADQHNNAR